MKIFPTIEYKYGFLATTKIIFATVISTLYWLAGRGHVFGINFHRRFYLPLIMILACIIYDIIYKGLSNKSWKKFIGYATMLPLYYGFMSGFGYGAGSWLRPFGILIQRIIVGIAWSIPALPVAWVNKKWSLYFLHISLFTITMGVLGTLNPIHATAEEAIIGFMFGLLVPFMIGEK